MSRAARELDGLLEPLERLDRLIAATFRQFGPRLVDLSYANPCDGPSPHVRSVIQRVTGDGSGVSYQYTPTGGRTATRRAIADRLGQEYGLPFEWRDIVMTAGAMSALNVVFRALFGPEDEVIVLTPAWQEYSLYLHNLEIPISLVPLGRDKHLDFDSIAGAIGPATRGVLLSHPCCPTGVLYSEEEIARLATILNHAEATFGTRIYLISDEVHRQMLWGRGTFQSPLLHYDRCISIYSFGKVLALQGQRIGYAATSPRLPEREEVRTRLERCVRLMGFGNPTSLMQYAVCDLLDFEPELDRLADLQLTVRHTLASYGYQICDADATFYVYAKSPIPDDFRFAERLAAHGVLVVPSTLFHDPGYVRLSLTARANRILAALPAFSCVLDEL